MTGIVGQTSVIHRKDRQRLADLQPHPDYSLIAAMEREIYGETFEHEGAPKAGSGLKQSGPRHTGARMPQTIEELEELVNDDARMAVIVARGQFPDFAKAYDKIIRRRNAATGKAAGLAYDTSSVWDATMLGTVYIPHTIIGDVEGGQL